jgi:hypothetical protein
MQLSYICPHWGQENTRPESFIKNVIAAGYNGIEINIGALQDKKHWSSLLKSTCEKEKTFIVIAQMVLDEHYSTFNKFHEEMIKRLELLRHFNPLFINAHTGKDYFSFDENCRLIQAAIDFSNQYDVPVYHETHRGRFSYALHTMPAYLKAFPGLELVADYSHWCTVSESMLASQADALKMMIPHVRHIHARVGYEQGPQLSNPFSPQYKSYLDTFTGWWRAILTHHQKTDASFTICTEAGPVPYMPVDPASNEPLASQWEINTSMLKYLESTFADF